METLTPYKDEPLKIPVQRLQFDNPNEDRKMVSGTLTRITGGPYYPAPLAIINEGGGSEARVPLQTVLEQCNLKAVLESVKQERFALYDRLCAPSNVEFSEVPEPTIFGAGDVFVLDNQTGTMQQNLRRACFVAGDMTLECAGSTSPGGALYTLNPKKKSNNDFLGGAVTDEGIVVVAGDGVGSSSRKDVEGLIYYFKRKQGNLIKACRQAAREMTKGVCVTAQVIRGFDKHIITIRIGDVLGRSRDASGNLIGSAEDPNNTTIYNFETGEFILDTPAVPQSALEYFTTELERLRRHGNASEIAQLICRNDEARVFPGMAGYNNEEAQAFDKALEKLLNRIEAGEKDIIQRDPLLLRHLGRQVFHAVEKKDFAQGRSDFDIRQGPIAKPGMGLEGASDGVYESLLPASNSSHLPDDEWGVMTREDIVAGRGPIHTMHRLAHLVDLRTHMSCSPDYFPRLWAFERGFKVDGDHATAYAGNLIRTP